MKIAALAVALCCAFAPVAEAQPLEQNFAFGAPLSALGNDRFAPRQRAQARNLTRVDRRGDVAVRVGRPGVDGRDRRWN